MTPIWRSSILHAGLLQKTSTRIFATGDGGDSDTCYRDNVVKSQRRLRLLSIQTLNCFLWAEYWLGWKNWGIMLLLVSNSLGCCLTAPGDHEGAARVINTHTIMFDPLMVICIQCQLKAEHDQHKSDKMLLAQLGKPAPLIRKANWDGANAIVHHKTLWYGI